MILTVSSIEKFTCTVHATSFPYHLQATISSTCPSQETIATLHGNAKRLIRGLVNPSSCGGAGWTRVAYLNMSDPQQTCPSNWKITTSPVRGCGRPPSSVIRRCDSIIYPVSGVTYSKVCGRIIAYHKGLSYGFSTKLFRSSNLEGPYLSGISLTHGQPGTRQHIWTFVGALNEGINEYNCPCAYSKTTWPHPVPSFIGNDYFCDTGNHRPQWYSFEDFYNDPLWDGEGCISTSSCCEFNSPPWFYKSLPQPTTDDLEMRQCAFHFPSHANKIISSIDIYIK